MGGGLPHEGVGVEKFVPSLESLSSLGFEGRNLGCPGNFAGDVPDSGGVKKFVQKKLARTFFSPNVVFRIFPKYVIAISCNNFSRIFFISTQRLQLGAQKKIINLKNFDATPPLHPKKGRN